MIVKLTSAIDGRTLWIAADTISRVASATSELAQQWPTAKASLWQKGDADDNFSILREIPEEVARRWRSALESGVLLYGPRGTEIRGGDNA